VLSDVQSLTRSDLSFAGMFRCPTEPAKYETLANREYKWGFVSDVDADTLPPGLSEETVRFISAKNRSRTGFCSFG
jgi:hypothetical protein